MYENITYALLLNRMLEKALSINNNLDTREGSLVWLGNAPAAVELQNLYTHAQLAWYTHSEVRTEELQTHECTPHTKHFGPSPMPSLEGWKTNLSERK